MFIQSNYLALAHASRNKVIQSMDLYFDILNSGIKLSNDRHINLSEKASCQIRL